MEGSGPFAGGADGALRKLALSSGLQLRSCLWWHYLMTSLKQFVAKKTARPTKQKKWRVTRKVHWPGLQAPSIATLTGEARSLACCRDTQKSGCTLAGAKTTAAGFASN